MYRLIVYLVVFLVGVMDMSALVRIMDSEFPAKRLKEANRFFAIGDYKNAREIYEKAYELMEENAEVNFKLAICRMKQKQPAKKILPLLEKAASKGLVDALYHMGTVFHSQEKFYDAKTTFEKYLQSEGEKMFDKGTVDRKIAAVERAEKMKSSPVKAKVKNMGKVINSSKDDYAPLLVSDETTLYFTSRREGSTGNLLDPAGEYFEDIYVSHKDARGKWSSPESVSDYLNTETHDATVALSPGGNEMYIYRTDENLTSGDIYSTKRKNGEWEEPVIIESELNSEEGWESSASLTADRNTIYFSSNREGGVGGKDIYRLKKLPTGEWSLAYNMGKVINTPGDEDFPFITPKGDKLYFSSNRHNTIGGYDVFSCSVGENGKISNVKNLGYPINSVKDEVCMVLSADQTKAYLATERKDSYGGKDLYSVVLPKKITKVPVVRFFVYQSTGNGYKKPIHAKITLFDEEWETKVGDYVSNKRNGRFIAAVGLDRYYKMKISAKGFEEVTKNFWLSEMPSDKDLRLIELTPLSNGK